jgi:hypothetical protein
MICENPAVGGIHPCLRDRFSDGNLNFQRGDFYFSKEGYLPSVEQVAHCPKFIGIAFDFGCAAPSKESSGKLREKR